MATIADAYIQIIPSADGISGQLSSIMDSEASSAGSTASGSFGSSFSKGLGTVATVGAATFGVFTAAVAGGTAALSNGISEVASYGDHVDKTSQKVGMSSDSFQQWDYVMNLAGTSMDNCAIGMKTLTNKIDEAKTGSEDAQSMFESLGISMEDLDSMSREDLFGEVISGMQNMEDSTERAALANDLFGRSGQEMTPLFNMTNEELDEAISKFDEYDMALSEEGVKASAAFVDAQTTMQGALSGLKNNMIADFLPGVTTVMDGLSEIFAGDSETGIGMMKEGITDLVDSLSSNIPEMAEVATGIIDSIIDALTENSATILTAGSDIIITLASSLTDNLPEIVDAASQVLLQLVSAFLDLAPELIDAGLTIIENLANGIGEALPELIPKVAEAVVEITTTLIDHLPDLIEAGLTIFLGLIEGLVEAIPIIIAALPDLISGIVTALVDSLPLIVDAYIQLMSCLAEAIPDIMDALLTAMPEIIDTIVTYFTGDGLAQTLSAGFTMFMALITALGQIAGSLLSVLATHITSWVGKISGSVGQMVSAAGSFFAGIGTALAEKASEVLTNIKAKVTEWVNAVKEKISDWKSAGQNLITGLWSGISDKASWLYSQITGMGSTIVSKVKSLFGISSPSKVFAEIGGYMAEGLGIGWDEGMEEVQNDINKDLTISSKIESQASAGAEPTNNLNGTTIELHDYINLGDTELKEIVSKYTIQQIGNETRAYKVAQGGFY